MVRLFAALPVPFEVAQAVAPLQTGVPGAKWRSEEQLHVTLRFFGDIAETAAEDVAAALAQVRGKPFGLALAGVGSFGESDRQHALWAGVADGEPLRVLAGRCEGAARRSGLPPNTRGYRPHMTLAYLNRATDERKVAGWIAAHNLLRTLPWRADRFGLYSSWQTANGSRYELEREYRL